jgi:hypothetical protein
MARAGITLAIVAALCLSGCIARTAAKIVTAPVKVAGKAVDLATTSQSEADEKRGRALREREERLGRLERKRREAEEECRDGDDDACDKRNELQAEIEATLAAPERE